MMKSRKIEPKSRWNHFFCANEPQDDEVHWATPDPKKHDAYGSRIVDYYWGVRNGVIWIGCERPPKSLHRRMWFAYMRCRTKSAQKMEERAQALADLCWIRHELREAEGE